MVERHSQSRRDVLGSDRGQWRNARSKEGGIVNKLSSGPIPLYHQLEQDIAARVAAGEFGPGDGLPTEEQIGQSYGVSRITVRKALDSLHQQGLILRRRGIGSFVVEQKADVHAVNLSGSLDDFLQTATRMTPRVLALAKVAATKRVADIFGVAAGSPVLRLELLSSTEDGPLAHGEFYFPERMIGVLSLDDIRDSEPIVRKLERLTGAKVVKAEQVIEPATAGAETAALLGIEADRPLLRSTRIYFTSDGQPVEIATLRYHPERYRYQVELRTRPYAV